MSSKVSTKESSSKASSKKVKGSESKSKKKDVVVEENIESSDNDTEEEKNISLERVEIKDKICYVENIEGGFIYDSEVKKIGVIQKGEYILYAQ